MKLADGPSLGSLPQVTSAFRNALRQVVEMTEAERSVILFGEGTEEPKLRASTGFPPENFWLTAPLSLTILRNVCKTGEPVEVTDVADNPGLQAELSLALANVRSLVCAPIWSTRGNVAGLIYVDWVGRASSARQRILPKIQEIARQLEAFLRRVEAGESNVRDPFETAPAQRPAAAPRPAPAAPPMSRRKRTFPAPDARERSIFFRSLSTMFGAGLPLVSSLFTLSKNPGRMSPISEELARRLERGHSLSAAAADLSVFPDLVVTTLRAGERSGRLHFCLERLADLEDSAHRRRSQLRAAMVYPAFVMAGCLLFLILAPAAMLSAQVKLLEQLHIALPLVSRVLLNVYGLVSQVWFWLPAVLGLVYFFRSPARRQRAASLVTAVARRWGPLQGVFRSYEMSHFTSILSLQLHSGLTVLDSLPEDSAARQQLLEGEEFWRCLRGPEYPRVISEIVRCGEETGRLPDMLGWLSRHFEEDFQVRLEGMTRLIEPLVMMVLGIVAGVLMIATLLPMAKALENL